MTNHKIRTTFTPGEVLTVDDAELLDLTRQGLVLSPEETEKIEAREAADKAKLEAAEAKDAAPPVDAAKKGK